MIFLFGLHSLILVGSFSSCLSLPMALSSLTSKGGEGKLQEMVFFLICMEKREGTDCLLDLSLEFCKCREVFIFFVFL